MGRVGWRRLLPVLAAGIALTFVLAGASLADHNPDYEGRADSHVVISGDPGCPERADLHRSEWRSRLPDDRFAVCQGR